MLSSHYDPTLVTLSILIAIAAAYAALCVAERITAATGQFRQAWMVVGALAMGFAVWSMHYVGMLAFRLPVPVRYNIPLVICSMLAAIAASAVALAITARPVLTRPALAFGAISMGAGIAAMHYIGMAAMRASCVCVYSPFLVTLSIIIAIVVSGVALASLRLPSRIVSVKRFGAAVILGAAICSMHYTGMAAAHFFQAPDPGATDFALGISWLGAISIAGVTFLLLALSLIGAVADRYYSAQSVKLESTEQRYQLLFERSLAGIYRSTTDGIIIDCNSAFINMLGCATKAEVLGRSLTAGILIAQQPENFLDSLLRDGAVASCEMQIQRADGSLIWVIAAGTLLKSSGTPQEIQGMFLSIQELKRKEIELTAAKVQADLASTAKSQFLANMSHELRTPLVGVLGMADIMESSQTTEDQRECLSVIRESAGSLLSLIGKILDYADQNQPGQPPEDETFSLVELVREEMQSARVSANDKGLTLQLSNKLQNDAAYCADARKIHLVVRALVENAVKFTEKGEIVVTISSRGRSPRAEFIRLSVCDTGIGISPEFHEAIFEPFSQADDSNSRRFGGAGIGLSLARESARSLGGEILLESALGTGSTFMLDIALRRDHSTYADRDESISASATK